MPSGSMSARLTATIFVAACAATTNAQTIGGLASPLAATDPAAVRAVLQPNAVRLQPNAALGREVVSAASDDDAIDAAAERLREMGGGASYVRTDAGLGIVGVGSASLTEAIASQNRNITERRRRFARVEAHLAARGAIAALLGETPDSGKQELALQRALLDNVDFDARNAPPDATVAAFLRGAVLYDCIEDEVGGRTFVTVVTSPRTQGDISFDALDAVTASNLRAAKDLIIAEIRSGVVAPSGGRVLTVLGDDRSVAFLAWSCEYVEFHADERTQHQIFETAAGQSQHDARRALLSLMRGEQIEYSREFAALVPDFEQRASVVIPGSNDAAAATSRRQVVESFVGGETLKSIVAGKLPPGVQVTAPESVDDGAFVFTVAFYSPQTAAAAGATWPDAVIANPLGKSDRRARSYAIAPDGTFETTRDGKLKPKSAASGQVSNKKDL
jgi:hypothetical protein